MKKLHYVLIDMSDVRYPFQEPFVLDDDEYQKLKRLKPQYIIDCEYSDIFYDCGLQSAEAVCDYIQSCYQND